MRRTLSLVFGLTAGAVLFAACRDAAVAPEQAALSPVAISVPPVSLDQLEASSTGISFTITIDPRRDNVYTDGINSIRFPAGSICDPATSSYGPAYWDAPCASATAPISLPITLALQNSRFVINFGRDLRFAPSSDPARHVVLTVSAPAVTYTSENLGRYAIFWVPSGQTTLVDEGASDASLVTHVNVAEGKLVRRLKHFSGYNLSLGIWDDCIVGVDPNCVSQPPVGAITTP